MDKSQVAVEVLSEVDPQFVTLCKTLFGNSVQASDVWSYVYTPAGVEQVRKAAPDAADLNTGARAARKARGALMRTRRRVAQNADALVVGTVSGVAANQMPQTKRKTEETLAKADVEFDVEFAKTDDEKRQVFGWASIVKMDGKPVLDRQGDWIPEEEIEKAAYTYVVKSRTGGHQHKRSETGEAFKAADMIESFVITDEKVEKMGLPENTPRGWWVGYHVSDDDAWARIKDGRITGFSIHGKGKRQEVSV